jgi:hypothetical protein
MVVADAPVGADHLTGALLRSLHRPLSFHRTWGVLRTLLLGLVSFGIYPLFVWSRLFDDFVRLERQQFWHLAEWLRLQAHSPAADELQAAADRLATRRVLHVTAVLWVLAVIAAAAFTFAQVPFSAGALYDLTYGRHWDQRVATFSVAGPHLFAVWTIGLSGAYLLHWLSVQLHASDVRAIIERANPLWSRLRVTEVPPPSLRSGLSPAWFLAALALALLGVWWGPALMLAGSAHRRYTTRHNPMLRRELAQRIELVLQAQRPPLATPLPRIFIGVCAHERCGAPLPSSASFCPRCGRPVVSPLARVA